MGCAELHRCLERVPRVGGPGACHRVHIATVLRARGCYINNKLRVRSPKALS